MISVTKYLQELENVDERVCPNFDGCVFYEKNNIPTTEQEQLIEKYCKGEFEECERYKTSLLDNVPTNLHPDGYRIKN